VTDAVSDGHVEKVVLARRTVLTMAGVVDPLALLRARLRGAERGFSFGWIPESGPAFVGHTPERLYRRVGERLDSEAVAGTRPRGGTPAGDAALAAELRASAKDRHEHAVVVEQIRAALHPLCGSIAPAAEPQLLRAGPVQHLHTPLTATLRRGVTDDALLAALHPTPAVAGHPRASALAMIADLERHSRDTYAGPVGWVSSRGASVAVAIRSAHVHGRTITLRAGAGIVRGSVPADEWRELDAKLSPFTEMLFTGILTT